MRKRKRNNEVVEFERSSGNIFADLDLPNPVELHIKSQLMITINLEIERRGLTQVEAAEIVGLSQSDISRIGCGHLSAFSIDRLLSVLGRLGIDLEITPRRSRNGAGTVIVRELV